MVTLALLRLRAAAAFHGTLLSSYSGGVTGSDEDEEWDLAKAGAEEDGASDGEVEEGSDDTSSVTRDGGSSCPSSPSSSSSCL